MIIHDNVMLWIAYDPKKRFEKELYKVWRTTINFDLIENRLLIHLYQTDKNYFMLPASKSKIGINVYFLFDIVTDVPNTRIQHRRYDFKKRLFINPSKIGLSD